jgi:hypothetical protein
MYPQASFAVIAASKLTTFLPFFRAKSKGLFSALAHDPTRILELPGRPEPALGPRPRVVFFLFFPQLPSTSVATRPLTSFEPCFDFPDLLDTQKRV